jgi:hypothetical protein
MALTHVEVRMLLHPHLGIKTKDFRFRSTDPCSGLRKTRAVRYIDSGNPGIEEHEGNPP